jgi:predicted  nucleic acid-binding Zn-ribbon protein
MRHPTAVIADVALNLAIADVQRQRARRQAQADTIAMAHGVAQVDELARRLQAARREIVNLEDEIDSLDAELIALRQENAWLRAQLAH